MACSQPSPASVLLMSGVRGLAVEVWISAIQTRHHNEDAIAIEKVEHYKSIDQPEHEFLAMHIQDSTRKTVFVVERSVLPLNDQRASAVLSYSSAISSPSSALTSVHANDVISISPSDASQPLLSITQGHKPYNLLRTLQFPSGNHPPDFHVAALLQLMKQHSPSYDIIRHQCFWYAGTIFEVLNEVYSGHEKKNPNYFHLLGTFSGIAIPGLRHSLDEIIEQFKIRLEDYRLEKKTSNPDYPSDEETLHGEDEGEILKHMREEARQKRRKLRHDFCDAITGHGRPKKFRQQFGEAVHLTAKVTIGRVTHAIH